jgi:hypothetical protein
MIGLFIKVKTYDALFQPLTVLKSDSLVDEIPRPNVIRDKEQKGGSKMEKLCAMVVLGIGALSFLWVTPALAGPVTNRQINQQKRIHQGVISGELTGKEATLLEREQYRVQQYKQAAWSDGEFTPGERARLHYLQDRTSAHIYKKKCNPITR